MIHIRQATINENDWTPNSDWAFSYDSSSGARSEQASQEGGVEGSYTTVGADGQLMLVRYRAGPEGFVVLNNDEVSKRLCVIYAAQKFTKSNKYKYCKCTEMQEKKNKG